MQIPRYNFKQGIREVETDAMTLKPNQIILIDSLHGLYSDMTHGIPKKSKFKLYIETLCQMKDKSGEFVRWTDLRLLRRMVRDNAQRSYNPLRTVGHWHYVRRSEMRHIVPFIHTVDYVLNSALPYELPLHKKHTCHLLPEIIKHYKGDPGRQDAYARSKRLYELLATVADVEDDSCVPPDALIREFIGGSCYHY